MNGTARLTVLSKTAIMRIRFIIKVINFRSDGIRGQRRPGFRMRKENELS